VNKNFLGIALGGGGVRGAAHVGVLQELDRAGIKIDTISGVIILGHVAGMTAEYESNLHVPCCVPIVMEAAKESCKEAYLKKRKT